MHDYGNGALAVYHPTLTVADKDGTPVATIGAPFTWGTQ